MQAQLAAMQTETATQKLVDRNVIEILLKLVHEEQIHVPNPGL